MAAWMNGSAMTLKLCSVWWRGTVSTRGFFCTDMKCRSRGQRNKIHTRRQQILAGDMPERAKRITLRTMDDLWADYLRGG